MCTSMNNDPERGPLRNFLSRAGVIAPLGKIRPLAGRFEGGDFMPAATRLGDLCTGHG
jgi:hypothetical protein